MKINLTKLLLDIKNKELSDFIYIFLLKKIGILKRDFIQNKSFNKKNGIYVSTINCMNFLLKNINNNINFLYLDNIYNINQDIKTLIYDFEICNYKFQESLLCAFMYFHNSQNIIIIIDILNMFVTCITNNKITNMDFGIKNTTHYFKETKIYSLIFNLIRFNKVQEYKKHKNFSFFNKNFRPLYEKTYIQLG
ncbi:hypothetical protein IOLA_113 [uncultured bacterium]|nr:hypothetical protein IOLA_113 [uncultured bacterium]